MYKDIDKYIHSTFYKNDESGFVQKGNVTNEVFEIRKLTKEDMEQIQNARINQEIGSGNAVTEEYLEEYKKVLEKLFDDNDIVTAGAFKDDELVSVGFFNLINYGKEKKIPYLCAVWTKPEERKKKLASQVNKKLMEGLKERSEELQFKSLLTVEGNEAAYNLYKKLGYKFIDAEMTFLGDIQKTSTDDIRVQKTDENNLVKKVMYSQNENNKMEIEYSNEQFFSHPLNMDGKMTRILSLQLLDSIDKQQVKEYLQNFLSEHRFCKFNINELANAEEKLYGVFGIEDPDNIKLKEAFEELEFDGINGQKLHIKSSENIMEKDLTKELELGNRENQTYRI